MIGKTHVVLRSLLLVESIQINVIIQHLLLIGLIKSYAQSKSIKICLLILINPISKVSGIMHKLFAYVS